VNVHDTNVHSHFYPIVSSDKIDPSSLGSAANEIADLEPTNDNTTIADVNDIVVESTKPTTIDRQINAATTIQLTPLMLLLILPWILL